jgi:hypothetical protein
MCWEKRVCWIWPLWLATTSRFRHAWPPSREDNRQRPGAEHPPRAPLPSTAEGHDLPRERPVVTPSSSRGDKYKESLRLSAVNLADRVALYNFLSTFSGTHCVTPRALTATVGLNF